MLLKAITFAALAGLAAGRNFEYWGSPSTPAELSTGETDAPATNPPATNPPTTYPPTPSPNSPSLGCGCNHSTLWLDIMLVIDSSNAMTDNGLDTLNNYLLTSFMRMTIGQQQGAMVSRVGLITYSDKATLRAGLNQYQNNDDIINNMDPPYEGLSGSNIESGIRLAIQEFGANRRSNTKQVIVIAASHYEAGTSTDPTQAAATFRENGGVIITLEYVQTHGTTVPILSNLASKCSQLSNSQEDLRVDQFLDTLCTANCFCTTNWEPYNVEGSCDSPTGGCYFPVTIPSAQVLAERYCKKHMNGGTLPNQLNKAKAAYLTGLQTNQNEMAWVGLKNTNGQLVWDDGTPYTGTNMQWISQPSNGQCVAQKRISGFNMGLIGQDCVNDFIYTCQNKACSSTLYCA